MAKNIFINNLDTYVSQAIFQELRNDQADEEGNKPDDANVIFGSYINKDSSVKPDGVKKMLKRSKPRLAQVYLKNCDLIVYDLHSGNPMDVKLALDALNTPIKEDDEAGKEVTLILVSSLQTWDNTPKKLVEVRDPREIAAEEAKLAQEQSSHIQAVLDRLKAERQKKRDEAAAAAVNSEEEGDQDDTNYDEQDQKEALRIVGDETAAKTIESKKEKLKKRMLHLPFEESDYAMRRASEEYESIREAEELVLNFKKEGVKTYVIASGLLYGKGEAILNSHFKQAWLQEPGHLPVVGQGNNLVPTVHVTDLARMVKKVYESKPERSYIFGIDNTARPSQKKLITAISSGIGTGLIEQTDIPHQFPKVHPNKTPLQLDLNWRKFLLMNIKAKPSSLFVADGAAGDEGDEPGDGDFAWHCKAGLAGNIQLVKEEFCKVRGLKPFKIALSGKPCTGKSHFAHQLAQHYNVPHIHTKSVLNEIEHWQDEKEANQSKRQAVMARIKEESDKKTASEQQRKADAEAKASKAKEAKEAQKKLEQGEDYVEPVEQEKEEVDPATVEPEGDAAEPGTMANKFAEYKKTLVMWQKENEHSDDETHELDIKKRVNANRVDGKLKVDQELLSEAFRWRLSQNDCQNRGYILDGYPISYDTSKQVFYIPGKGPEVKPPTKDDEGNDVPAEEEAIDEEALAEMLKPKFQTKIYPDSVILIRGDDDYIKKHAQQLSKDDNTKWDRENLSRRLEKWSDNNNVSLYRKYNAADDLGMPDAKVCKMPITRFFQEHNTEVFEIDCSRHQFEMFEAMRVYIERNGRSYNYLSSVKSLNHKREEYLTQEELEAKTEVATTVKTSANEERAKKEALMALADGRLEFLENHMDALSMTNKMFMRQFLMKCIIPVLTEGMIDVWRVQPTDPVDYLADYVYKKSNEMK